LFRKIGCRAKERNRPALSLLLPFLGFAVYRSSCQLRTKCWRWRLFLSVFLLAFAALVWWTGRPWLFFLAFSAVATTPNAGGGGANHHQGFPSASLFFGGVLGSWLWSEGTEPSAVSRQRPCPCFSLF